jgi:PKD repeat protein
MEFFAMSSGVSPLTATLQYVDGTSDIRNISVPDWYNYPGAPTETATFFNLALNLDKWDQNNNRTEQQNHYLYGFDLVPNQSKQLKSVKLTVISGGCFTFWGATGVSNDVSSSTINFDASTSFDADFDPLTYTWNFGDSTSGTGIFATHTYSKGGYYSVTLTVNDGNGGITTVSQTITVYPLAQYAITATANPGGTISPEGIVSVTQQQNQSFTIVPAMNYSIADVLVDSVSVGTPNSFTFSNVTKAHSIAVSFVPGIAANLALGKPVTVSTTEATLGHIASNVTDGDATTRWSSLYADPQWLYVDLLSVFSLRSVILNWEVANAKNYSLDFSVDGITWTNAITKNAMATGLRNDTITLNNQNARYVRVSGTARNTIYGYSIFEIQVYGSKQSISQSIALQTGWNLISFNVSPSNKTIDSVFKAVLANVIEIKTADAFWEQGQNGAFNSLKTINDGAAYLVKMKSIGTLNIAGQASTSVLTTPTTGWQMIGCPFQSAKTIPSVIDSTKVTFIKNFEAFWSGNPTDLLLTIEPGKGYFLKAK